MGKKNMKGIVFAVILIVAAGFVLQVTGILGSLESAITPQPCSEAPYANNCICASDESRFAFGWSGMTRYICEPTVKVFDPNDLQVESDMIASVQEHFNVNNPECNMIQCDESGQNIFVSVGQMKDKRVGIVECQDSERSTYWFSAKVDIYDGTVYDAVCAVYVEPTMDEAVERALFKSICDESIDNEYCNHIFSSSEYACSTHEIYPDGSTRGTGYNFESVKTIDNWQEVWTGCGYIAAQHY